MSFSSLDKKQIRLIIDARLAERGVSGSQKKPVPPPAPAPDAPPAPAKAKAKAKAKKKA